MSWDRLGTHPLQELCPLLLLVTTSCCCYFVFLPAPFPPLFFLIQLQQDKETQIRASRCGSGQEVGVSTWQGNVAATQSWATSNMT